MIEEGLWLRATRCTSDCSCSRWAGVLAPTFWGLVLFPVAVLLVLWGAILPEERYLHERFGARYDDYSRRVPWLGPQIAARRGS